MDALGNLVRFLLLPGQRHDSVGVAPLIEGVAFDALIADKAFDHNWLRAELDERGAAAVIPSTSSRKVAKVPAVAQPWRKRRAVLSKVNAPPLAPLIRRSPLDVYRHSPLATEGCIAAGPCMGALWALGPAYAAAAEMDPRGVGVFMASALLGGLALVWPLGRLSDRLGRRGVIAAVGASGCAVALFAVAFGRADGARLAPLAILYGGAIFSLYPLAVSHGADHLGAEEDMLKVTRGLLLASNVGMAVDLRSPG